MNTHKKDTERDICRLLGGLLLDGANLDLVRVVARERTMHLLSAQALEESLEELGAGLLAMQRALVDEAAPHVASEYTRLVVASTEGGARRSLLVPPWEDCWLGSERRVLGERSRAVLAAYVAAGLGFDAMKEKPADHVGLELCFLATLLDEETHGERDGSAHDAFAEEHLGPLSPQIGGALVRESRGEFWRETGRVLQLLPGAFAWPVLARPPRAAKAGSCPGYRDHVGA